MVYYKLIFGIIFLVVFTLLLIRTRKRSLGKAAYILNYLDIVVGIAAGVFLIITSFKA